MEEEIPAGPIEDIHNLQCLLQDHTNIIGHMIEENGDVLAVQNKETEIFELVHDYSNYCFTKGARTLTAIDNLLTEKFLEDSLILLRSVYECYLNATYCVNNPDKINNLIGVPVGLIAGRYENPKSKKGYPIRQQFINPNSKKVETFHISIEEMSTGAGNEWDTKAHRKLYAFLSEFAHVHMIASGAYRTEDNLHYTLEVKDDSLLYTMMLSAYVSYLLLDIVLSIAPNDSVIKKRLYEYFS